MSEQKTGLNLEVIPDGQIHIRQVALGLKPTLLIELNPESQEISVTVAAFDGSGKKTFKHLGKLISSLEIVESDEED